MALHVSIFWGKSGSTLAGASHSEVAHKRPLMQIRVIETTFSRPPLKPWARRQIVGECKIIRPTCLHTLELSYFWGLSKHILEQFPINKVDEIIYEVKTHTKTATCRTDMIIYTYFSYQLLLQDKDQDHASLGFGLALLITKSEQICLKYNKQNIYLLMWTP